MARININNSAGKWYDATEAAEVLTMCNLDTIAEFMDDDVRESVHNDMAPCTDAEFLAEYLRRAPADLVIG